MANLVKDDFVILAKRDCPGRINRGRKWYQLIGFPLRMSRWNFFLIIFQPLSVHEHKTIKGYLIGSTWDCLVDFKGR